ARFTSTPPLAFDSPDPRQRVLHYCSLYNNGVAADGTPDPTTVTRASHVPPQGFQCQPVACTAGRIGASCATDATCDSSPGGRDGVCDACRITGGGGTENEKFILIGSCYRNSGGGGATEGLNESGETLDAEGRSTTTDVVLPPAVACSSSHARHAGMHATP